MNIKHRFIKAILKQPVDKTPIWLMRQAGRYLPEYRELRQKAGSFMQLCQTPELACEVTLQPLRRFNLDAAILFSDILTIPDAMGLGLYFTENEGPKFKEPLQTASDIAQLGIPDPEQALAYVPAAVRLIKKELQDRTPLIGFAGSPWTLATYMIENGTSKNFSKIKAMIYQDPRTLHQLLELLAKAVRDYLNAQITAGVDAIMIFDTWGGVLTQQDYQSFSLQYMQHILQGLTKNTPTILYTKGGGQWLELIAATGCHAIGIDWSTELGLARQRIGNKVALQGNLDPCTLYGNPDKIREQVAITLQQYGMGSGHIFNLGHGIYPDINPEHVQVLVDAVHELSEKYHDH